MLKRTVLIGLVAVVSAYAIACGGDDDDGGGSPATNAPDGGGEARAVEVSAKDFALSPTTIDVTPGEKIAITLTNTGNAEHSFTIEDGVADIDVEGGKTGSDTLTAPDKSVEFYCKYHPTEMRGTINVTGDAPSSSSSSGGGAGY